MNILLFVDDFVGGAGKNAQVLSLSLLSRGYDVSIVLVRPTSQPRFELQGIEYQFLMPDGSGWEGPRFFKAVRATREIIRSRKPDLIITFMHNISILVAFSLLFSRIPLIVSERADPIRGKLRFPWNVLRVIMYRRANKVSILFDDFKEFDFGINRNKCVTTPNPVLVPPKYRLKDDLPSEGPFTFITMSRLSPTKNVGTIIRYFAEVHHSFPQTRLVILGDGKDRKNLENIVDEYDLRDWVDFKGNVKDIYDELSVADAYLMASRQEGFPNALVEAMSTGLPVIAFACHSGLKNLIQNGVNGFLLDEGDKTGYVNAMNKLLVDSELYQSISRQARKITDQYSLKKTMDIWESLVIEFKQ